jgi:hypothetical protein
MKETPHGTSVGVDDPYEHADVCDHVTEDGRCRFAFEHFEADPDFARVRRDDDYRCPIVSSTDRSRWSECRNFQSTTDGRTCARCGLGERSTTDDRRPLLEEHHLSYPTEETTHEITIALCRWCHAKVHNSWAAVGDDVRPDPKAIAERERRKGQEQAELEFDTAADRYID